MINSITTAANYGMHIPGRLIHGFLVNPKITTIALTIFGASVWRTWYGVKAGPLAFMACYASCMAAAAAASAGAFLPAAQLLCMQTCSPLIAMPCP